MHISCYECLSLSTNYLELYSKWIMFISGFCKWKKCQPLMVPAPARTCLPWKWCQPWLIWPSLMRRYPISAGPNVVPSGEANAIPNPQLLPHMTTIIKQWRPSSQRKTSRHPLDELFKISFLSDDLRRYDLLPQIIQLVKCWSPFYFENPTNQVFCIRTWTDENLAWVWFSYWENMMITILKLFCDRLV